MSQRGWLIAGLLILLCGGFAYWLYLNLEQREFTVSTPPSAEAIRNPLLAAERLMREVDQQVESVSGSQLLNALPATDDVLLIYKHSTPMTAPKREAMLAWVAAGGHLIFDVAQLWDRQREEASSTLLEYLQVQVFEADDAGRQTTDIEFEDTDEPVSVRFKHRLGLRDLSGNATAWVGNDNTAYMLQFEQGEGLITVINDLSLIDNDHIGKPDHAYFLYLLANTPGNLWLLYDPYHQSLVSILLEKAPFLLFSLLLLALAWVWRGLRRIAPLQPVPTGNRRNLVEHIQAIGQFEWRYGQLAQRYQTTQKHIEQGWLIRHPHLQPLPPAQRARWVADLSGEEEPEVYAALYGNFQDDAEFIRRSALLARLRRWT